MPQKDGTGAYGDAGGIGAGCPRDGQRGPRLDMLPPELWSGVRGFVVAPYSAYVPSPL